MCVYCTFHCFLLYVGFSIYFAVSFFESEEVSGGNVSGRAQLVVRRHKQLEVPTRICSIRDLCVTVKAFILLEFCIIYSYRSAFG